MFKDIKELKEFISWAKENKIKSFKIKDIEIEISELSFTEDIVSPIEKAISGINSDTLADTDEQMTPEELEELLLWSAQK